MEEQGVVVNQRIVIDHSVVHGLGECLGEIGHQCDVGRERQLARIVGVAVAPLLKSAVALGRGDELHRSAVVVGAGAYHAAVQRVVGRGGNGVRSGGWRQRSRAGFDDIGKIAPTRSRLIGSHCARRNGNDYARKVNTGECACCACATEHRRRVFQHVHRIQFDAVLESISTDICNCGGDKHGCQQVASVERITFYFRNCVGCTAIHNGFRNDKPACRSGKT